MNFTALRPLLIVNPSSGPAHRRSRYLETIKVLKAHFSRIEVVYTRKRGDALRLARSGIESGVELVWCAGGDGTINEVVNALYGTGIPLGIIPTGTGNGIAREIGLSLNPLKAVSQLLQGELTSIFPGKINEKLFLLVSGAGYDAFVAAETDDNHPTLKKMTGFFSYLLLGLTCGRKYAFPRIVVEVDGEKSVCYGLLVMKARGRIGPFTLAPSVSLTDPRTGVFLFRRKGILTVFHFFVALVFGFHRKLPGCPFILCREIVSTSEEVVPVQCDGERMSPLPATWKCAEKNVVMIFPKRRA